MIERVRSLIRLEALFERLLELSKQQDPLMQQVAIKVLFELVDACERAEIRSGLMQEIDKQKQSIEAYRGCEGVNDTAIDKAIHRLQTVADKLTECERLGQSVRDNKWLIQVRNRFSSFGFATPAEVPVYYLWQTTPVQERMDMLNTWIVPLLPLYNAIKLLLENLRNSAPMVEMVSKADGTYCEVLKGKSYQLARIQISGSLRIYPELTANRHMMSVSFKCLDERLESDFARQKIPFQMALCHL
ncbi:cell division protein ZapD [Basilea psittacipulmonis]|uniref:cell division protein ZapD n=1 Tax=Basilea psittacipulmonis TaxID=1472345 RepID=UPI0013016E53|nr:cell division protein ZapD [Basilea psittacipulmonis]